MALTMYALVRVSDGSKVTEARETTHLANATEAWLPIAYEDQPTVTDKQVAERVEGVEGVVWRKSWKVRNKTAAEKKADRLAALATDEAAVKRDLVDILDAILGDDEDKKSQVRARLADIKSRKQAES